MIKMELKGPVYAHDCDACVFLGHYEERDLYYCPGELGGTVIARASGKPSDYASGLPFGRMRLGSLVNFHLRVAYLIAADLGYVPFVWDGVEFWPEGDKSERGKD